VHCFQISCPSYNMGMWFVSFMTIYLCLYMFYFDRRHTATFKLRCKLILMIIAIASFTYCVHVEALAWFAKFSIPYVMFSHNCIAYSSFESSMAGYC